MVDKRISQKKSNVSSLLTLHIEEHPGADGSPVQVIVGKASPVAKETDGQVGNATADGPGDRCRCGVGILLQGMQTRKLMGLRCHSS